jgi:hypothetical protein
MNEEEEEDEQNYTTTRGCMESDGDDDDEGDAAQAPCKKRKRGANNKATSALFPCGDGTKEVLRLSGSTSKMREFTEITPQEKKWCKKKVETFNGFTETNELRSKEFYQRHCQVLLIMNCFDVGTAKDGMAYKYGTYVSFFIRAGGFSQFSDFVPANENQAKKIAEAVAREKLRTQTIKVGKIRFEALLCNSQKQEKLVKKLSSDYMQAFSLYCNLLPLSPETLTIVNNS